MGHPSSILAAEVVRLKQKVETSEQIVRALTQQFHKITQETKESVAAIEQYASLSPRLHEPRLESPPPRLIQDLDAQMNFERMTPLPVSPYDQKELGYAEAGASGAGPGNDLKSSKYVHSSPVQSPPLPDEPQSIALTELGPAGGGERRKSERRHQFAGPLQMEDRQSLPDLNDKLPDLQPRDVRIGDSFWEKNLNQLMKAPRSMIQAVGKYRGSRGGTPQDAEPNARTHSIFNILGSKNKSTIDAAIQRYGDETPESACVKKWYVLNPMHPVHVVWDIYLMLLLVFTALFTPLTESFEINTKKGKARGLEVFNIVTDSCFIVDIGVNFFTAYDAWDGKMVTDLKMISSNYLKTWFALDVFSVLPIFFTIVENSSSDLGSLRAVKSIRILKLVRLLKFLRLSKLWRFVQHSAFFWETFHPGVLRMLKLFILMVIGLHWVTCGVRSVGLIDDRGDMGDWLGVNDFYNRDLWELSKQEQYLHIYYFAICSFLGEPSSPHTWRQLLTSTFAILIGLFFEAYIIGTFINILSEMDSQNTVYRQKVDRVTLFMHKRRLPTFLRDRILNFFEFSYSKNAGMEDQEVLHDLPVCLQREVALYLKVNLVKQVKFFECCSVNFVQALCADMESVFFLPGDVICYAREVTRALYFVCTGKVNMIEALAKQDDSLIVRSERPTELLMHDDSLDSVTVVKTLGPGSLIGVHELLADVPIQRSTTIIVKSHCEAFVLQRGKFMAICSSFPDEYSALQAEAEALNNDDSLNDISREEEEQERLRQEEMEKEKEAPVIARTFKKMKMTMRKSVVGMNHEVDNEEYQAKVKQVARQSQMISAGPQQPRNRASLAMFAVEEAAEPEGNDSNRSSTVIPTIRTGSPGGKEGGVRDGMQARGEPMDETIGPSPGFPAQLSSHAGEGGDE